MLWCAQRSNIDATFILTRKPWRGHPSLSLTGLWRGEMWQKPSKRSTEYTAVRVLRDSPHKTPTQCPNPLSYWPTQSKESNTNPTINICNFIYLILSIMLKTSWKWSELLHLCWIHINSTNWLVQSVLEAKHDMLFSMTFLRGAPFRRPGAFLHGDTEHAGGPCGRGARTPRLHLLPVGNAGTGEKQTVSQIHIED